VRWLLASLLLVACGEEAAVESAPPVDAPTPAATRSPEPEAEPEPAPWVDVDAESLGPSLRAHESRYLLVNVWSTWCEPCVEEMPQLVRTAGEYEDRGLGLVLISADAPAQRDAAHDFLVAQGAPMPSWFKTGSDDAFIRALHEPWSGGLPATLLMDEQRNVVHFWEDPVTADALRGPIEDLIGGPT